MTLKAMPGRCEEASALSGATYIPCNRPATRMIGSARGGEGPYRMCEMCASHSVHNRGMVDLGPFVSDTPTVGVVEASPPETSTKGAGASRSSAAPAFLKQAVKDKPQAATVDPDRLVALRAKVAEARDLEAEKADLEQRASDAGAKLRDLDYNVLPTMFDELGISDITMQPEGNHPGVKAEAKPFYRASIPAEWDEDRKQDAFACLKEEGAEDLIKMTVVVAFPREQHEDAALFAASCREQGFQVIAKEEVHWGTLTSWLKDMIENHNHVPPLDRIGGTVGRVVKRKIIKAKK